MLIADFFPYVASQLPRCPDETLRVAVVLAVQKLCDKAHIWRETQFTIPLINGSNEIDPDYPAGARVVNVSDVSCGGEPVHPVTLSELSWRMPDWQTAEGSRPAYFTGSDDWGTINVYPKPKDPTESLTMRVDFEPLITATSLPDFILQRYQGAITSGVLSHCMLMPNTTWSNPQMGIYWRDRFESDASDAAIKMLHDKVTGGLRVVPRRFG